MKKNILILIVVAFLTEVQSQNFEGTFNWSIESPSLNKKIAKLSETNSSEATKMDDAKQQMMEQLKNPDIANNPQAKEMIEKMLAQLSVSEDNTSSLISNIIPTGMIMKFKNGNSYSEMVGGVSDMIGGTLTLKGNKNSYLINKKNKEYSIIPSKSTNTNSQRSEIIKMNENLVILGYNCTKYQINSYFGEKKTTQFAYFTTEIKGINAEEFKGIQVSQDDNGISEAFSKINGIPLKMEINIEGNHLIMECKSIKKMILNEADFKIPTSFKQTK